MVIQRRANVGFKLALLVVLATNNKAPSLSSDLPISSTSHVMFFFWIFGNTLLPFQHFVIIRAGAEPAGVSFEVAVTMWLQVAWQGFAMLVFILSLGEVLSNWISIFHSFFTQIAYYRDVGLRWSYGSCYWFEQARRMARSLYAVLSSMFHRSCHDPTKFHYFNRRCTLSRYGWCFDYAAVRAQRCSHVAEQSGGGTTCRFHGAWNAHVMHIIPFAYISLPSSNTKKDSWKRGHTSASIFYPASLKKAKHASHSSFYKGPKSPFSPPSPYVRQHVSFHDIRFQQR